MDDKKIWYHKGPYGRFGGFFWIHDLWCCNLLIAAVLTNCNFTLKATDFYKGYPILGLRKNHGKMVNNSKLSIGNYQQPKWWSGFFLIFLEFVDGPCYIIIHIIAYLADAFQQVQVFSKSIIELVNIIQDLMWRMVALSF